ncbi:MAG: HAMP domain-containing histidine kinase [Dehalococcoidia bacterium]|nr:HAMP domain-containing histidine kinase [Dehalococcoidia bacterium]
MPAAGPREVRELAATFNRMTEEVERSQQTLRDFLANISHELKTPLTSILGFSHAILDGVIDEPEGVEHSAGIISSESDRVLRLVEGLLDISRIESGQLRMAQRPVRLFELFEQVGDVFSLRSEEAGVHLSMSADAIPSVRGDFDRLEQGLSNLVDNAIRHTPRGGRVRMTARVVDRGLIQVAVADTGAGVDAADLPHLFDRFYCSRNGSSGKGHGLGLAITREIVRAHGGDIWATSEPGRGTIFAFTLPVLADGPAAARARRPPGRASSAARARLDGGRRRPDHPSREGQSTDYAVGRRGAHCVHHRHGFYGGGRHPLVHHPHLVGVRGARRLLPLPGADRARGEVLEPPWAHRP